MKELEKLTKLESLHISNTDIDSGLEYLSNSMKYIYCLSEQRSESKVKKVIGLVDGDKGKYDFKIRGGSRERKNAQEWLEKEYPRNKRKNITELDLRSKDLGEELSIENWPNLERLDCGWNQKLTRIKISNLPELNFFSARNCQISNLTVENCPEIGYFNVKKNSLSDLTFVSDLNPKKLTFLDLDDNNFPPRDVSIFNPLIELEELYFGNGFWGSLEPLKNLTKLKNLGIFTPSIDSGLEHLSASLEKIYLHSEKESDKSSKVWEKIKDYSMKDKYGFLCYNYQSWREKNIERIDSNKSNINEVSLLKPIVKELLQVKISYLESLLQGKPSINIGSVSLYSYDVITLQAENGKYLKTTQLLDKTFFKIGTIIKTTRTNSFDESSYFIIEIIEGNKVRLRTYNENLYYKVLQDKDRESPISFTNDLDESTLFLINGDRNDNKITLQVNNTKKYLRLSSDNKSIVAKEKGGDRSKFSLSKETNCQKKVEVYQGVIEDKNELEIKLKETEIRYYQIKKNITEKKRDLLLLKGQKQLNREKMQSLKMELDNLKQRDLCEIVKEIEDIKSQLTRISFIHFESQVKNLVNANWWSSKINYGWETTIKWVRGSATRTWNYLTVPVLYWEQWRSRKDALEDWRNIHPLFTSSLVQSWIIHEFTIYQAKDWINVGLWPRDVNFAVWLRDTKQVDAGWLLDHGNEQDLRQEFKEYQKQNGKSTNKNYWNQFKKILCYRKDKNEPFLWEQLGLNNSGKELRVKEFSDNLETDQEDNKLLEEEKQLVNISNESKNTLAVGDNSSHYTNVFRKRTISDSKKNKSSNQVVHELVDLQIKEEEQLQTQIDFSPKN